MRLIERELKLRPDDAALLDRLAPVDHLGPFQVVARRAEQQRNSFFDSRTRALGSARLALRRRCIPGQSLATWTLKSEGEMLRGVATRPEIELQLRDDTPPIMALSALSQAARQRGAGALQEEVADAMRGSPPPLAAPFLELVTDRRILDLQDAQDAQDVELELSLDHVRLAGHPRHVEHEIEVELRRGDEAALESARTAIAELGSVQDGQGSKLSRALDHVRACAGC
jgi:inorganic triphosphatase YgiF